MNERIENHLIFALELLKAHHTPASNWLDDSIRKILIERGWLDKRDMVTAKGEKAIEDFHSKKSNPKKMGRAAQKRISKKIRKLVHEGYSVKRAAKIAYEYERKHMLGPRGGKKKNPIFTLYALNPMEQKDLSLVLAWMLFLRRWPWQHEYVPENVIKILQEEGYVSGRTQKLTAKGEKFLSEAMAQTADEGE